MPTDNDPGGGNCCQMGTGCCIPLKDGKFGPKSHACTMKISAVPRDMKEMIETAENDKFLNKEKKKPSYIPEKFWNEVKKKHLGDSPPIAVTFYSCLAVKIIHLRMRYDATQTEQILMKHAEIVDCVNQTHKAVLSGMLLLLPGHPIFYVDQKKKELIGNRNSFELKLRDLITLFGDFSPREQRDKYGIFLMPSVGPWQLTCFTKVMITMDDANALMTNLKVNNLNSNEKTIQSVESLGTSLETVTKMTEKLAVGLQEVNSKIMEMTKNQVPAKKVVSEIQTLSQIVKGSTNDPTTKPSYNENESKKLQQNQAKVNKNIEAEKELFAKFKKQKYGSSLNKGTIESNLKKKAELKRLYLSSSHYILDQDSIRDMAENWNVEDLGIVGAIKIIELRKTYNFASYCVYFKSTSNAYKDNIPIGVSWKLWKGSAPLPKADTKYEKDLYLGRLDKNVTTEQVKKWLPILFPDVDVNKIRIVFYNYDKKDRSAVWRRNLKFAYCHIVSSKKDTELILDKTKSPPFDLNVWKNVIPKLTNSVSADKFDTYKKDPTQLAEYTTFSQFDQSEWITVER